MANAWIAGLILLLVAVAVVIPTVQTSISKATTPYYFQDTNDTTTPFAGTYRFSHYPILNGTESCFNATSAADALTRDVNYTMNYWTGVLTNKSISPAWTAKTFNCTYWYSDESYMTQPANRSIMGTFMVFLVLGVLMFFIKAIGLI